MKSAAKNRDHFGKTGEREGGPAVHFSPFVTALRPAGLIGMIARRLSDATFRWTMLSPELARNLQLAGRGGEMQKRYPRRLVQQTILAVAVLLLFPAFASGATYYVRTDGNDGNDGLANTAERAWRTIAFAAVHISPGDVVRVQSGTYPERVGPAVNGASVTQAVTFVADGPVSVCGWNFSNNSYIRVIGFTIDSNAGCSVTNECVKLDNTNSYLEFWNNTFRDAASDGIRMDLNGDVLNSSVVIGNRFLNMGIGNGSGMAMRIRGNHNLIAYNEMYNLHPDALLLEGTYNRYINNYIHDLSEASGGHSDVFQAGSSTQGLSYNLIEANFQVGMGNLGDEHTAQISNGQPGNCSGACGAMTENIFRRNVWHNVSSYTVGINQTTAGTVTYTRYYHNTTAGARRNAPTVRYGLEWYGTGTSNSYIHNNLEYKSWGDSASSNLEVFYVTGGVTIDYNLAYDPGGSVTFASPWTTQANAQSNLNPALVNYAGDDFTLGVTSAAIGNGGPLTTTSGGGTGTTFNVVTRGGGFFRGADATLTQYGGAVAAGDVITIGNDTRSISGISGDSITVTAPFTWTDGEPIFYGNSSTPDIGAYPFRATGYALTATLSRVGGTVTVTPSAADLVRFVVCYEDEIPIAVDGSSPYTCSVGTGIVDVRVYPRYATKTLWVTASSTAPAAPTSLRIIRQ